jgi:hypothetical protein
MPDTLTETVTLDRDLVERLVVELDGLASVESIRSGRVETWLFDQLLRNAAELQHAAFGDLPDDAREDLYRRGIERGEELARELFGGEHG